MKDHCDGMRGLRPRRARCAERAGEGDTGQAVAVAGAFFEALEPRLLLDITGLTGLDIGPNPGVNPLPGGSYEDGDVWVLQGGGNDVFDVRDAFHYEYQSWEGDFDATIRVLSIDDARGWIKAGIMAREELTAGSAHAFCLATPGNRSGHLQGRTDPAIPSYSYKTTGPNVKADGSAPLWLRLLRNGDVFYGCWAEDDNGSPSAWSWTQQVRLEDAPDVIHLGLALTAHDSSAVAQAQFDQFTVIPFASLPDAVPAEAVPGLQGGDGYFGVREVIDNGLITNHAEAIASLQSGLGTIVDYSAPVLNILDTGGSGRAPDDNPFGVVAAGHRELGQVDHIALAAKGTIRIPEDGDYTFLVRSDDSFRLAIDGAIAAGFDGWEQDILAVKYLTEGLHSIQLTYREGGGGANLEMLAVQGQKRSYDTAFRLVGDDELLVLPAGVPAGEMVGDWHVKEACYLSGEHLGNLEQASALLSVVDPGTALIVEYDTQEINLRDPENPNGEGAGEFGIASRDYFGIDNQTVWGQTGGHGNDDDFALRATGVLRILQEDDYSIGVHTDDGYSLRIEGAMFQDVIGLSTLNAEGDTMLFAGTTSDTSSIGHVHLLPGDYPVTFEWFERGGHAFAEISGTIGFKDAFDNTFTLLGGEPRPEQVVAGLELVEAQIHPLTNPGFETGTLDGWVLNIPTGGYAVATGQYDSSGPDDPWNPDDPWLPPGLLAMSVPSQYLPVEGEYFALLKTDGPGSYTTISQEFNVRAGDVISGWAFFDAQDYWPYDDNAQVVLRSGGTTVATLFDSSVSVVGDYGRTPWTYWEHEFHASGEYVMEARVANSGDDILDSHMGLDGIAFDAGTVRVVAHSPAGGTAGPVASIQLEFSEPMASESFSLEEDIVGFTGPEGDLVASDSEWLNAQTLEITFDAVSAVGTYTMAIGAQIQSLEGELLDQDYDGIGGEAFDDRYIASFEIRPGPHVIDHIPSGTQTEPVDTLTVTFSEEIDLATFTTEDILVEGPLGVVPLVDDPTHLGGQSYEINLGHLSDAGPYFVHIGPDIESVAGILMDQDRDMVPGEVPDDQYVATFEIVTGLFISAHSPSGDQVEPVSEVAATFSDPVDLSTLSAEDFVIEGPWGPIPVVSGPTLVEGNTYQVGFEEQSAYGVYHVHVGPEILSANGIPMDQDRDGVPSEPLEDRYDASFTIIDVRGPQVAGHAPALPVQAPLEYVDFTFDEEIDGNSFDLSDVLVSGPAGPIQAEAVEQLDPTTFRVSFPAQSEKGGYTVTIGSDITDVAGNRMDQDGDGLNGEVSDDQYTASVEIDLTGPVAVGHSLGEVQNAAVRTFEVSFNEAIDASSFTAGVVTILGPAGSRGASEVAAVDEDTFRITVGPEERDGTYTVVIAPAVADLAGNLLDQDADGQGGEADEDAYRFEFVQELPDLRVTSIAHPTECRGGTELDLEWIVTNVGQGVATGVWSDTAYLSQDSGVGSDTQLAQLQFDQPLAPGESYTRTVTVTMPEDSDGNLWFIVSTDSEGQLDEQGEQSNNTTVGTPPVWVTTRPYPDLQVLEVYLPDTLSAGETATVSWTVRNLGTGATSAAYWFDEVWLSTDTQLGGDTKLAQVRNPDFLAPGESYTQTADVLIPDSTPRDRFYLIVKADGTDLEEEFDQEGNNVTNSPSDAEVITPAPGFFTVVSVEDPGVYAPGAVIPRNQLHWTIQNTGGSTITSSRSYWDDGAAISRDEFYNEKEDLWLDGHLIHHTVPLGPGETRVCSNSYGSHTIRLPNWEPGTYYLVLVPDTHWFARTRGQEVGKAYGITPITLAYADPPDLAVTSMTAPASAVAGQEIELDWHVENQGIGDTRKSSWADTVYLSLDETLDVGDIAIGSRSHTGALDEGEGYGVTAASFRIPGDVAAGNYYVLVETDSGEVVSEGEEANNVRASDVPVTVAEPVGCDLAVILAEGPASGVAGETILVEWSVTNNGPSDTATGAWADGIYLSTDTQFDASEDRLLAEFDHSGVLTPGAEYARSESVALPDDLEGTFHVIVVADNRDNLYEHQAEDNNALAADQPIVIEDFAPDLAGQDLTAPATGIAGQAIDLDWLVANAGTAAAASPWQDAVYLSEDASLDAGEDERLGSFARNVGLGAGEDYGPDGGGVQVMLPARIEGSYHLFLVVDDGDAVYEKGVEANNVLSRAIEITDLAANLTSAATAPADAVAGQPIQIDWQVGNAGTAPAEPVWRDAVYLSQNGTFDPEEDALLASFDRTAAVGVGDEYDPTDGVGEILLPDQIEGTFTLFFVTDDGDAVYEKSSEADNVSSQVVEITDFAPDLRVESVVLPAQGIAGDFVVVDYRVVNEGTEAATGQWQDALYLSADTEFDPEVDNLFGRFARGGPVEIGETYGPPSVPAYVRLPERIAGTFYVFAVADDADVIYERDGEDDNVHLVSQPIEVAIAPADLQVSIVEAPVEAVAGSAIRVGWTVVNEGHQATDEDFWRDGVYVSEDDVFDPTSDIELGMVTHAGTLVPGAAYSRSELFDLRQDLEGPYYIYVVADARHQVFEHDGEDNNTTAAAQATAVIGVHADLQVPDVDVPDEGGEEGETHSDLQTSDVEVTPEGVAGSEVLVRWTTTNVGPDTTAGSSWLDSVYISADDVLDDADVELGAFRHNGRLAAGEQYTQSRLVALPEALEGPYFILVKTDSHPFNDVYEYQAEHNNVGSCPIDMVLAPPADLQVTAVASSDEAWSGQSLLVEWTVANQGGSATEAHQGGWSDSVYLSRDPYVDPDSDIHLGHEYHAGDLAADGASYTASLEARLPAGISGPYYVLVRTDTTDRVFERGLENNNTTAAAAMADVKLTPPCDLQVTDVTPPAPAAYGEPAVWQYEVTNMDTLDAMGAWYDTLYLSADDQWDIHDARIARVHHVGDVLHAESYTETVTADVPAVVPGDYYVIVRTDIRDDVRELNDDNNTGVSAGLFHVEGRELTLGEAVSGQLSAGEYVYYQVTADAGADFAVLVSDAAAQDAQVYVAHGRIPTRTDYDAKSALTADGRQAVSVSATEAGAYYVLTYAGHGSGSRDYAVVADTISFSIRSVTPETAGNAGYVTLTVHGARFTEDMAFELLGSEDVVATSTQVLLEDSTRAFVTFDTFGVEPGDYSLRAIHPEEAPAVYTGAVSVVEGQGADVQAVFDGPLLVRSRRPGVMQLQYGNEGDADGSSPLFLIDSTGDTKFGLYSDEKQANQVIHVLGLGHDGPLGILRPGTDYALPVYYQGQSTQTEVRARAIFAADPTPIEDWAVIEAAVRPAGITNDQWATFWERIRERTEPTWGGYVRMLNNVASILPGLAAQSQDASELLEALFAQDSDYVPYQMASGTVMDADTGQPVEGLLIGLVAFANGQHRTVATSVVGPDGCWELVGLPPGTYEIVNDKYAFDMDQDLIADLNPPQIVVEAKQDVAGVDIHVLIEEETIGDADSDPAMVTDRDGVTHMVWNHANTVMHTFHDGASWAQAGLIFEGASVNIRLVAADGLLGNGEDGLIATWEHGTGNERTVYFSVGRKHTSGWEWSQPEAVVDVPFRNSGADVLVMDDGTPLVVYLTDNADIQDDTDQYYTLLNVDSDGLAWPAAPDALLEQLDPAGLSVTREFGFSHTWKAKIPHLIDASWGLSITGSATASACNLEAGVEGKIFGSAMIPGVGIRPSLEGHGSIVASWEASETEPVWVFQGALGNIGAEGGITIVGAITTILRAFPQTSWLASILSKAKKVARKAGWTIEDNLNGSLGVDLKGLRWNSNGGAPLPSWRMPDSWGTTQVTLAAGPSFEVASPGDSFKASVAGELAGTVEWGTWKWMIEASLSYEYNLWNWIKDAGEIAFSIGPLAETEILATLDSTWVHDPASGLGTGNVYGSNPVLTDVAADLLDDGSPSLARDAQGQGGVILAWSKATDPSGPHPGNRVLVAEYADGAWTEPEEIAGVDFNTDVTAAYTPDGHPVVVWSHAPSDTIDSESTIDDLEAAMADTELYFSICEGDAWSAPMPIAQTLEIDGDIVLETDAEGNLRIAWAGLTDDGAGTVYTAVWKGSAWSDLTAVAGGQTPGQVELAEIGGSPALYWVEDVSDDPAVRRPTILSSVMQENTWSAKAPFSAAIPIDAFTIQSTAEVEAVPAVPSSLFGIPFPDECLKCTRDKLEQRDRGSGDCFVGTEIDWEKCIEWSVYRPCDQGSHDPNDILGLPGYGEDHWVTPEETFDYTVRFENMAEATASAQLITVTHPLDADLDWSSFELGSMQFGDHVVDVPGGLKSYQTVVDLRPEGNDLLVDIVADFDAEAGLASWTFTGIDPETGELTEDPLAGFLPPNDPETHSGEGFVSYSIQPKADLPSGSEVTSEATIVFDWNEPIDTPVWRNTIDAGIPNSAVDALPDVAVGPTFEVTWAGVDDPDGVGVSSYDIYVSTDGEAYESWLEATGSTSAEFLGDLGRTYAFYSVARDHVGHVEAPPAEPDTVTTTPPGTAQIGDRIWLDWDADGIQDGGEAGLAEVAVNLYASDDELIDTTVTDTAGYYLFEGVDTEREYYLAVVAPAALRFSPRDQGEDDEHDSDVDPATARTEVFSVSVGKHVHWDAGLYELAEIHGVVWDDANGNGEQDLDEAGLPGRTVYLDADDNGQLGPDDPTTVTDEGGHYSFVDLTPGEYVVAQVVESGWEQVHPGPAGADDRPVGTDPLAFDEVELLQSQGADIRVLEYSVPSMVDWNSDGVADLVVGEKVGDFGKIRVYLNEGDDTSPVFAPCFFAQADGGDLMVPAEGCLGVFPRVTDWDGDGRKDLLLGLADGRLRVYLNVQTDAEPAFSAGPYVQVGRPGEKAEIDVGSRATPDVTDWNGDGLADLLVGGLDGRLRVYVNEGTAGAPDFREERTVVQQGADLLVPGGRSSPSLADMDGDGLKDLVTGNTDGQLIVYLNTGSDVAPSFAAGQLLEAGGAPIATGTTRSRPFIHDFDGDGLSDCLVGGADGLVRLYRRQGSAHTTYTTTSSEVEIFTPGFVAGGEAGSEASELIGLTGLRADPNYEGIDGSGLAVVVIDTGLDLDHQSFGPDEDANGVADRIVFQYDFADEDAAAGDASGHGSHVTSILASSDSSRPGIAPGADIIHLKVFGDDGRGTFADAERALQWVVENAQAYDVAAVNLSFGDRGNWDEASGWYGISDELAALAAMDVIVVSSAGNNFATFGSQPGVAYPAADPNTVAVGAVWDADRGGPWSFGSSGTDYTTAPDRIAAFSQRHEDLLDVFAPGTVVTGADAYGGTTTMSGTSQAAPFVTGAAVLAQQLAVEQLGRFITPDEFRSLLESTGQIIFDGDDEDSSVVSTQTSYVRLDIHAMAEAVGSLGPDRPDTDSGNVPGGDEDDDGSDTDGGGSTESHSRPFANTVVLHSGESQEDVDFGLHQLNTPPTAQPGGPYEVSEGGTVALAGSGDDAEQDPATLVYEWDLDGDGVFGETGAQAERGDEVGPEPIFDALGLDGPTSYDVALRVTDAQGATQTALATIDVLNAPPLIDSLSVPGSGTQNAPIDLAVAASDPAGVNDPLTYTWTVTRPDSTSFPLSGTTASFTPDQSGTYTVVVEVADDDGGVALEQAEVMVAGVVAGPEVTAVVVNDGDAQRSKITSLTVYFDRAVTCDADAFVLTCRSVGDVAVTATLAADRRSVVLTCDGLADGIYDLTVRAGCIEDDQGGVLAADHTSAFHCLFGDADGDGDVDGVDVLAFRGTYGRSAGMAGYLSCMDYDGNDTVDRNDYLSLLANYRKRLTY